MQYLLDFIQEHMITDELRIALDGPAGGVEILRQRSPEDDNGWLVRVIGSEEPARRVPHATLLETLQTMGVNMQALQSELHASFTTQVTFAELLLRDASQLLGAALPASTQAARRELLGLLWLSLQELSEGGEQPSLRALQGDAIETPARTGHLTLVT
jgi:hypothetical protein